jgi:hypothetical protein
VSRAVVAADTDAVALEDIAAGATLEATTGTGGGLDETSIEPSGETSKMGTVAFAGTASRAAVAVVVPALVDGFVVVFAADFA